MHLPNWFKIAWWALLIALLGLFLYERYPELVAGHASYADVFVFLVWMAVCLTPLFQEMKFFGLAFRQHIQALREHVDGQINTLRADIRNSIDFRPQITFPSPPSDAQLPILEKTVQSAVRDALARYGTQPRPDMSALLTVDKDASLLFAARRNLERELQRIAELTGKERRRYSIFRLTDSLVDSGILDSRLASAIRDVVGVCSPAIHGEEVTQAQVGFVRDTAPGLISALQAIGNTGR